MTEEEARGQVQALVGEKGVARLDQLTAIILAENEQQNLIARSTVEAIWVRHVLDSIQLLRWAGDSDGLWLDIGTGGGFPGLAIATAVDRPMILVEPRRARAEFLRQAAARLELAHVEVQQHRVEAVDCHAAIISARAVASLTKLFTAASGCAKRETRWILPRGISYAADLREAEPTWRGVFHVEQSLSDPDARIVIGLQVERR